MALLYSVYGKQNNKPQLVSGLTLLSVMQTAYMYIIYSLLQYKSVTIVVYLC